ncbi:MAG: tannase/feruloyl esterase family alpha/beta hydrolase, partial [Betaproteobacteria bacterium]
MFSISRSIAAAPLCVAVLANPGQAAPQGAEDCRKLFALTGTEVSITTANMVPASGDLPQHCHVTGLIPPNVGFEVKLPAQWNGKFFMAGNGGFAGRIQDEQTYGLRRGYATAATDTGHEGPDPRFALNRAAEIDYGYRSVHVTQAAAKRLIAAHYGRGPGRSYFKGCSTGGRQALLEAQRYPGDFDGIIAGAPIYDFSHKQAWNAGWVSKALFGNNRAGLVPLAK